MQFFYFRNLGYKLSNMKNINLTYVTTYDGQDIHALSGTNYFIAKALEKQNVNVEYVGNLAFKMSWMARCRRKFHLKYAQDGFLADRDVSVAKNYAKEIQSRISPNTNVIFSPSTIPIALLPKQNGVKKVFYTDATFGSMIDYNSNFFNLGKYAIKQGNRLEKKALESCDLAIFASDWAAENAINDYNVDPKKVKVVPRGAGFDTLRTKSEVEQLVLTKSTNECNLLFVGKNWEWKGGDIALGTAKILHKKGQKVHLDIVGVNKCPVELPDYVTNHGFISKSTEEGIKKMETLFSQAHFFILPTRSECMGISFCEASSFGLPSLATNTGGVSTAVRDGVNGKLFELSDSSEKYAEYIEKTLMDFESYKKLCFTSFEEYENCLNWEVAGKTIVKLIEEIL